MRFTLSIAVLAVCLLASPARALDPVCVGDLQVSYRGAFDARLGPPARQSCDGGPRPDGDGLRVAYRSSAIGSDDQILTILAIPGILRGETGTELPLNVTVVREGKGEFFGARGPGRCTVDIATHEPAGDPDLWRLAGEGRCQDALEAVAREGEITVSAFEFSAVVSWEMPEEEILRVDP